MKLEWEKATELVRQAGRILVLTHVGPDGDAIGSMMGLAHTLRDMGKHAITAVDGGTPDDLAFIPGSPDAYAELRA
ncbi:MAG: bifunctional oligoribonuclease/PAP phosphatase NrnA, partial [Anaerolineae bacterium]|nr:bifunctional oligoribonuclease/PAP phosphatase NrnA [Anaerolineae bacterium]